MCFKLLESILIPFYFQFMTIIIDAKVSSASDLEAFFTAAEINYEIAPNPVVQNAVTFKRELIHQVMGDDLKVIHISSNFFDQFQFIRNQSNWYF